MIGTAALRLPRRPDRRALQLKLLRGRAVAAIVAGHGGRLDYLLAVLELADRRPISTGAALAGVRRAVLAGHVVVDDSDLVLPADSEAA